MPDTRPSDDPPHHMEQRILRVMRKVLAKIVREVAPRAGAASPLSDETIEDIRECFNLISIREKELAAARNLTTQKPVYPDQTASAKPVRISHASVPKKNNLAE